MSRFMMSPGMADFLAQYRRPRWEDETGDAGPYMPDAAAPQARSAHDVTVRDNFGFVGSPQSPQTGPSPEVLRYSSPLSALVMSQPPQEQSGLPSYFPNAGLMNAMSQGRSIMPEMLRSQGVPENIVESMSQPPAPQAAGVGAFDVARGLLMNAPQIAGQAAAGMAAPALFSPAAPDIRRLIADTVAGRPSNANAIALAAQAAGGAVAPSLFSPLAPDVQRLLPEAVLGQSAGPFGGGPTVREELPEPFAVGPDVGMPSRSAMLARQMGLAGPQSAPTLPAPPSPTPEPMVGPIAQERQPWQSTITTGSGVVTTAYPQIGDGQYGTGQVVGDTRPTGPKSIQEQFRDRFTELRRDQSYGLFGMPAGAAAGITNMEMQPLLAQQELGARAAEGDANRQMQMALERSRIEAGKYDRQQQLQSDIAKAGINAAGSGQLGPFLRDMQAFNSATGGRVLGPAAPVAAAGSMPANLDEVSPDERGRRLIQQLAPLLPKTFQYVAPGTGRDRVAMTGTAEALDPTALPEIFNRVAGAGLDEPAMRSFLGALRTSQGGQQVYERLLSQSFADDIAARNQPTTQRGLLSRFMSLPVLSMFSGGAGASTYPAQINFDDFPGTSATAVPDKTNIDRLGRSIQGGMPNYTLTTPTGMTLPLPVRDALGGDMNRIKAQEQMRLLLRRVGLSAQ